MLALHLQCYCDCWLHTIFPFTLLPASTKLVQMHAGAWATEILEVLAPLVINCREAAEQLVTLGGLQALSALVHHPAEEPLPLSLMLDMVEALVALGDDCVQAEVRQMLVRDGLLQPVLQALRMPGLNRKSVAILSHMAKVRFPLLIFTATAAVSSCTTTATLAV